MDSNRSEASKHGTIVTENPELLALLKENTMDQRMRRVYVDSPVIRDEDDSKYRFVSTEVDGFDHTQDMALQSSPTARGNTQPLQSIAIHDQYYDGVRYEDRNMNNPEYSPGNEMLAHQTEFVIRSRDQSKTSFRRLGPAPVQPIRSPLKPLNHDEEEDRLALEEERKYQEQLRSRLQLTNKDFDIPVRSLAPIDSLDEPQESPTKQLVEQPKQPTPIISVKEPPVEDSIDPKDSLDPAESYNPKDSLDANSQSREDIKVPPLNWKDSDEESVTHEPSRAKRYSMQMLKNDVSSRESSEEDPWANRAMEDRLRQEEKENERLQKQLQEKDFAQLKMQQEMQLQQQQLLMQQQQQLQNMVLANNPMMMQNMQMMNPYTHAPMMAPQMPPPPMHPPPMHQPPQVIAPPPPPDQSHQYVGSHAETDYFYEQYQQEAGNEHSDTESEIREATLSRAVQNQSPGRDFLELNKKQLGKKQRSTTYSQMLSKRKDLKQEPPSQPPSSLKKKKTKKQPLPNRDKLPQSLPNSASAFGMSSNNAVQKPASAEHLWSLRSQSLMTQKEDRIGEGRKKKPHKLPQPQKSKSEPSKAPPIHHTVYTDDGQQVSVDINLKVTSPTPQAANVQEGPKPPLPQEDASWHPSNPQRPMMMPAGHPNPIMMPGGPANPMMGHMGQGQQMMGQPGPTWMGPPRQAFVPYNPYTNQVFASPRQRPIQDAFTAPAPEHYEEQPPPPRHVGSPYRILPAIGSADTDKGRQYHSDTGVSEQLSPRMEDQGSYMDAYQKSRNRKFDYKSYTLKDYKTLKKDLKLGGLGPEINNEDHREKREKLNRQQNYAKKVQEKNRTQALKPGRPRQPPPGLVEEEPEDDIVDRRKIALEYAKSVPKPKIAPQRKVETPPQTNRKASERTTTSHGLTATKTKEATMMDLDELQRRHEQERQQVALIQQNINTQAVS